MRYLLIIACVISLFACTFTVSANEPPSPKGIEISFPERGIDDWSIGNAIKEANEDITTDKFKIYYSGTRAAYPPGVEQEDMHLIKDLPIASAGIGCIITDPELREAKLNYARKYNEIIINHLK